MFLSVFTFLLGVMTNMWRYFMAVMLGGATVMFLSLVEQTMLLDKPGDEIINRLPEWLPNTLYYSVLLGVLALPVGIVLGFLLRFIKIRSSLIYMVAGSLCGLFALYLLSHWSYQRLDKVDLEDMQLLVSLAGGAFAGFYYRILTS